VQQISKHFQKASCDGQTESAKCKYSNFNLTNAVTQWLAEIRNGDRQAAERLLPVVYEELRRIARRVFACQHMGSKTIQRTILVHDVFMKPAPKRM